MRKLIVFVYVYCISLVSTAQSPYDVEAIINLCLDQTELVPQNHKSADGSTVILVVDNGVLPKVISIDWFNASVLFKTKIQIAAENTMAYIQFDSFEILNPRHAKATYTYICNNDCSTYSYTLEFTKYTQFWTISRNITDVHNEISLTGVSKSSF